MIKPPESMRLIPIFQPCKSVLAAFWGFPPRCWCFLSTLMQILARSRHGMFEATILLQWVGTAIESPVYIRGKDRWKTIHYSSSEIFREFAPFIFAKA